MKSKKKVVQASSIGLIVASALSVGLLCVVILQAAQIIDLQLSVINLSLQKQAPTKVIAPSVVANPEQENVLFIKEGKLESINIVSKKIQEVPKISQQILSFQGLPKEIKNSKISVSARTPLLSHDRTQALVVFTTYDATQPPSDFDGSLPVLSAKEFMCTIATKSCVASHVFADAYASFKFPNDQHWFDNYAQVYWSYWDSEKHLLYGNARGEGIGSAAPIKVFATDTKKLTEINVPNAASLGEYACYVPSSFLSPSLRFAVIFTQGDNTIGRGETVSIFDTNNFAQPIKTISLSDVQVSSLAWSSDEKELVLMTNKKIYILNLQTDQLTLKYTDTTQDSTGLFWDSNTVAFSPSGKHITFVDFATDEAGKNISNLVSLDVDTLTITELVQAPYLRLYQER